MSFEKAEKIAKTVSAASVAIVAILKTGYIAVGAVTFLALLLIIKDA